MKSTVWISGCSLIHIVALYDIVTKVDDCNFVSSSKYIGGLNMRGKKGDMLYELWLYVERDVGIGFILPVPKYCYIV